MGHGGNVKVKATPFGTVLACRVLSVRETEQYQVVVVEETGGDGTEAFVLINGRGHVEAAEGDEGTITMTPGGPTGGHWAFRRDPAGPPGCPGEGV